MINSDSAGFCQAIAPKPKEPVEHAESGDHSPEVRTLTVPPIIPRSPVNKTSELSTFQGASVARTDGIKKPVESSIHEFSDKVVKKSEGLFRDFYFLLTKEVALNSYSTDGLFPYLHPEKEGSIFCLQASRKLTHLLSDDAFNSEEKDQILKLFVKRFNQSHIYSDFQKKIINDFFESVYVYSKQKAVFSDWESKGEEYTSTVPFYTSMHKLMIEGERRENDVGWFPLNDEVGYLDRCCRAFMFLINEITMHPDAEVNMSLLNKAAAIVGTITTNDSSYGVSINKKEDNPFFVDMLKKGRIYNRSGMPDKDFKRLMNDLCKEELKDNESSHLGSYLYSRSLSEIAPEDHKQPPHFLFILEKEYVANDRLIFRIKYKTEDKQADCEELLRSYYESVADKNEMLEIIEDVVNVCCEIQRRHPFYDGNGRLLFFILPSILLYQKGIWLKETLHSPWSLIDSKPPAYIAARLVDLCIKRPVFNSALDWKVGLTEPESAYVYCAMGELEEFKRIISEKPELLNTKIRSSNKSLLQIAVMNNRTDMVKYIIENYPDKTNWNQLKDFLATQENMVTIQHPTKADPRNSSSQ